MSTTLSEPIPEPADARNGGEDPLLAPGRTCWRVEPARRMACLVDADDYFRAVHAALAKARHQILLIGWDFDTRMAFGPETAARAGTADRLGPYLDRLVAARPGLRAHVLKWDFSMIFALEREMIPVFVIDWMSNPRVSFRVDGRHPRGASHHQKLVVVDDRVAFCGGLDLTARRWDTRRHLDDDPGRVDPGGAPYAPFHDAAMAVDGAAAAAIGTLARERWRRATGETLAPPPPVGPEEPDAWPDVVPSLREVGIGIARTDPEHEGRPEVREVEALYLEAIRRARRSIYLETQYFTCERVADAIAARLAEPDGPEVVVIGPHRCSGWLEEEVMGPKRQKILRRLRARDRHGRFRLLVPVTARGTPKNVHAKIAVIDDRLLRIGSANLNNRSMGLDTECDLAVEAVPGTAREAATRRVVAGLRDDLLAEHLGRTAAEVGRSLEETGSLVATIEALGEALGGGADAAGRPRLLPLEILEPAGDCGGGPGEENEIEGLLVDSPLIDPERPVRAEDLTRMLLPDHDEARPHRRFLLAAGALVLLAGALLALWRFTPLSAFADVDAILGWAEGLAAMGPAGMLLTIGLFVAGSCAMFPVTVMIAVTAIALGPLAGFATALAGSVLAAAILFALGRFGGRDLVRRFGGRTVNRISRRLGQGGILTVAVLRVMPVAPFTVVNLVAGASHLRFTHFVVGTLVGMTPGVLAFSLFGGQLERALRDPAPATVAVAVLLGAAAIGLGWIANRLFGPRGTAQRKDGEAA
ncbi:VTT domain-containing protein [Arenibaculum sp.]|uniref:VTT domain-containing protein n=1 Tax=Arenibaculum sp. TaxID=2865862 RepID=UPI002E0FB6A5|nr:VTT domain-containing protein [Arenibaculum sp.]